MSDLINDKKVNDILHSVGLSNNLRDDEVKAINNSVYKFIYTTIRTMEIEGKTPEEIDDLRKTFIIKYIGKLYTDKETIRKQKVKQSIVKEKLDARAKELE